jgi:hypothetical protein
MNEFEIGDVVNDTAGNAGEVVEIPEDGIAEVEWDDGSITTEMIGDLIWVSH